MNRILALLIALAPLSTQAAIEQTKGDFVDKFRQLDESLPTANAYRTAGGEPGHAYWQQEVDYDIDVRLDENARRLSASQTVTYTNNSPDTLRFLWLQLDQNRFRSDSLAERSSAFADVSRRGPKVTDEGGVAQLSLDELRRQHALADNDFGFEISKLVDSSGQDWSSQELVDTVLRLPGGSLEIIGADASQMLMPTYRIVELVDVA